MVYHYIAAEKSGKIIEDDFDADNLNEVLHFLAGKELRPVSVKALKENKPLWRGFSGKITANDKVFLTKYLALMLKVGTDLLSAINILLSDFDKPAVRNFLLEVRDNLSKGQQFYRAFEARPDVFSTTFVSLVKAAEASGNLQSTFEELSGTLVRETELKRNIRSALVYPIILLGMSVIITTFLVVFAMPRIAKVFLDSGVQPPPFSRIVFSVGLFAGDHVFSIFITAAVIISSVSYLYFRTNIGKKFVNQVLANLPLVKPIYRDLAIQRLASTMSSLMNAGLPIIQTINVAAETVGFSEFKFSLMRIADEGLAKGLTIGEAFKREVVFPKVVTNLIAISEKAGHLGEVLSTLADFYASNVNNSIKSLVSLLEPLLLLVMGVLVAIIALAIIVPIYQLTTQF